MERAGKTVDPHRKKMLVYPEVPMLWYFMVFVCSFAMAMATIYTGHTNLPWWGLIVALIFTTMFMPFVVTVFAITGMLLCSHVRLASKGRFRLYLGFVPNIQNLIQMLGAAIIPGNPQANMYFTLYGFKSVHFFWLRTA